MVKIMIADDHALIRRVVREVVEKESDLEIIAEACNGHEAEEQAAQTQPDVVLMDLDMPNCDGFEATERVLACSPHSRVVIFTASHQEQDAFHAIQRGAIGYITKDIEPVALVHAIRCAARDELCLPRSLASQLLAHLRILEEQVSHTAQQAPAASTTSMVPASSGPQAYKIPQRPTAQVLNSKIRPLTEREREILDLMRRGLKNREIARELSIAESTVHKHIQNIFEKLHARNRTEAIYLTTATAS
jgi:two-component system, NarL family, nitrate/nitrite response regulator NarL